MIAPTVPTTLAEVRRFIQTAEVPPAAKDLSAIERGLLALADIEPLRGQVKRCILRSRRAGRSAVTLAVLSECADLIDPPGSR